VDDGFIRYLDMDRAVGDILVPYLAVTLAHHAQLLQRDELQRIGGHRYCNGYRNDAK
jgi:hypothetical protein